MLSDVDEKACGAARGLLRVPKSPRGVVLVRPVHHRGVVEEHGFPPSPRRLLCFQLCFRSPSRSIFWKIRFFHPKKKTHMKRSLLQAAREAQKETQTRRSVERQERTQRTNGRRAFDQHNHALRPHREYPLFQRPSPPAPRPRPPALATQEPSLVRLSVIIFHRSCRGSIERHARHVRFEPT